MSRVRLVSLALLAVVASGCSGGTTVADPGGSPSSPSSSSTGPGTTAPSGRYPSYQPTSYTYTLRISCFCLDSGVPIRITVADGEATSAVYAQDGRGVEKGAAADDSRLLTINDLIDQANKEQPGSVVVDWPDGEDHPSRIVIEGNEMVADDGVSYELSAVLATS